MSVPVSLAGSIRDRLGSAAYGDLTPFGGEEQASDIGGAPFIFRIVATIPEYADSLPDNATNAFEWVPRFCGLPMFAPWYPQFASTAGVRDSAGSSSWDLGDTSPTIPSTTHALGVWARPCAWAPATEAECDPMVWTSANGAAAVLRYPAARFSYSTLTAPDLITMAFVPDAVDSGYSALTPEPAGRSAQVRVGPLIQLPSRVGPYLASYLGITQVKRPRSGSSLYSYAWSARMRYNAVAYGAAWLAHRPGSPHLADVVLAPQVGSYPWGIYAETASSPGRPDEEPIIPACGHAAWEYDSTFGTWTHDPVGVACVWGVPATGDVHIWWTSSEPYALWNRDCYIEWAPVTWQFINGEWGLSVSGSWTSLLGAGVRIADAAAYPSGAPSSRTVAIDGASSPVVGQAVAIRVRMQLYSGVSSFSQPSTCRISIPFIPPPLPWAVGDDSGVTCGYRP